MANKLSSTEEQWFIDTVRSPADWAEAFLKNPVDPQQPLRLRSYQREVLENTRDYKNMVLRYGRRMGKTVVFCADLLWWGVAQPLARQFEEQGTKQIPVKILILTPMDSQIKMIFDTILQLCADSPFINGMITKIKRSDVNEIHFNNGSVIKGMTIGISSANKGTSARGQSADYIFLDEADFIPRDVMEESILPIASTNTECKMRVCSTPSGKRDLYYEWCTRSDELGWWHRHYPSWHVDNPSWISIKKCEEEGRPIHESTEYQFKSVTEENAYNREYGAEFGEELLGVYKNQLLNKSIVKYCAEYDAADTSIFDPGFEQVNGNKYIIGVDWNSYVNGGQVVVLELCIEDTHIKYFDHATNEDIDIDCTGKFRLFYRKGVKVKDGTQRATREEIIRLMTHYRIDHVYVDYGYGDTNIEELTHYGKEHPSLGIRRKLHVIDSGSNIEHYDVVLQKMVKKRAKSLMINTGVVSLEEGRLVLPKEEDNQQRLIHQMRNYTVKSVTVKGDYTYEGDDHILDAFNLAMWGFHHQYSTLLNTRYENKIKFMQNPVLNSAPVRKQSAESPILNKTKNIQDPEKVSKYNLPQYGGNRLGRTRGSNSLGGGFRRTF